MENSLDIDVHEAWFAAFAARHRDAEARRPDGDIRPMELKIAHSAAVLRHTRRIVEEERFAPPLGRACLLAALYHDVARFPQYARWHTFKDSLSADHGLMGLRILKAEERMAGEEPQVRAAVLAAVGMHNRFHVPKGVREDAALVTDVVRDADKLDIFRIMAGHLAAEGPYNEAVVLHVPNAPELWSPVVVRAVMEDRVASYGDLTCINDLRLLLGTWMHELRFAATRRALLASGLVPQLLAPLPQIPEIQAARAVLLQRLETLCA